MENRSGETNLPTIAELANMDMNLVDVNMLVRGKCAIPGLVVSDKDIEFVKERVNAMGPNDVLLEVIDSALGERGYEVVRGPTTFSFDTQIKSPNPEVRDHIIKVLRAKESIKSKAEYQEIVQGALDFMEAKLRRERRP